MKKSKNLQACERCGNLPVNCYCGSTQDIGPGWQGTISMGVKPDTDRITDLQAEVWVLKARQNVGASIFVLWTVILILLVVTK